MNVIEKIKETQQAGALICPRCGRMSMDNGYFTIAATSAALTGDEQPTEG